MSDTSSVLTLSDLKALKRFAEMYHEKVRQMIPEPMIEEDVVEDARMKNVNWHVLSGEQGILAVLMDIRDELQATRDLIAGVLEWLRENSAEERPAKK